MSQDPGFFSQYDRFKDTSTVASDIDRLNFRYSHVIETNRGLLEGKRVLDIASHDARFSFAALKGANAQHVTGIEARESMVDASVENMRHYKITEDRYSFWCGDVFEKLLEIQTGSIDTAMILGFLYHTARQYELISAVSRIGVKNIIVDSRVLTNAKRPIILLRWEGTKHDSQIWDASRPKALSSEPSVGALQMILEEFGYTVDIPPVTIPIPKSAQQYRKGTRVMMVATKE